ncbi:MAG: hypothetical protein ACRD1K_21190 [Acidimicrobiales bacterium]
MGAADRRHRRRRPRWLIVGLGLSITVLVFNAVVSSGSDGRGARLDRLAYVDQIRPHVEESTAQGSEIEQLRADPGRLGREGIGRRMDRVVTGADDVVRAVAGTQAPPALDVPRTVLVATMAVRAGAVAGIRDALGAALTGGPDDVLVAALVRRGEELVAADLTYQVFVDSLPTGDTSAPMLPPSRWVADPRLWSAPELGAFVGSMRSAASVVPVNDVRVLTVDTDPAAVGQEAGAAVLPLVRSIRLEIVVSNVGNRAQEQVPVVASLQGADGQLDTAREFVDLAPGQRRSLSLAGLRPPPAGGLVTLTVVVGPVDGETPGEDNQRSLPLLLRG